MACREIGSRPARPVAVIGPRAARAARMPRRVGSATAANTASATSSGSGCVMASAGQPGRPGGTDCVLDASRAGHEDTSAYSNHLIAIIYSNLLVASSPATAVSGAHLTRALGDLLDAAQAVTRTLLGVGVDPADLPAGGALSPGPGRPGMMACRRARMSRHFGQYGG